MDSFGYTATTAAPPPSPFTPSSNGNSKKRGADDMEDTNTTTPQSLFKRRWTDATFSAGNGNDGSMNEMVMEAGGNAFHAFGNGSGMMGMDGNAQHPGLRHQISMPSFPTNPFIAQHNGLAGSSLASPAISTFSTNDTASVYENGEHPFVFEHDSPDMRDEDVSFSHENSMEHQQQQQMMMQQMQQQQQQQQQPQNPIDIQALGPQHPLAGFYDSYNGHGHFYRNQEEYMDDDEDDRMAARYTGNGEYDCYTAKLNTIMGHA